MAKTKEKKTMPGPGSHNVPMMFEKDVKHPSSNVPATPSFSMSGGRREETPRKDKAGPGQFHPDMDAVKPRTPGWGFGNQKRLLSKPHKDCLVHASPDLGQQDNPRYNRSPRYGFGCTSRKLPYEKPVERRSSLPGPSDTHHEDLTSKWANSPNFSILTPRARKEPENPVPQIKAGPGPGAYAIDCPGVNEAPTYSKTPYYKFSSSARFPGDKEPKSRSATRGPGPGAYWTVNATRTGQNCFAEGAPKWSMPGRAELDIAAIGDPATHFANIHF